MNKMSKKILSVILSLSMLASVAVAAPFVAEAVDTPKDLEGSSISFWADPENRITQSDITAFSGGDKTSMVGAVGVFKRSNSSDKYYLFLPSNADCNALKLWFTGGTCTVNGNAVTSGEATNVFSDCDAGGVMHNYTLVLGSDSYNLNVMKSGDVGAVYIDTDSGSISKITNSSDHSTYEGGTIMVVNADGTIEYDGVLDKMSGRGNGTWSTNSTKNPYNIKLAASTKLLGMPKAKKWCLLANKGDGTLVRNQLTYDFADYIGVKYQPHCKPVDLYVNQQYYGAYNLAEKVEIKSNRVGITDNYENLEIANGTVDETTGTVTPADMDSLGLSTRTIDASNSTVNVAYQIETSSNYFGHTVGSRRYSAYQSGNQTNPSYTNINDPDDLTGGYIFELEISQRWAEENAGFCAYNRQGWTVKSNDYISRHQVDYCYNLLYALGSAVYNGGTVPASSTTTNCSSLGNTSGILNNYGAKSITNPAPSSDYIYKKWSDILDSESAVKYYWTQEYFKNMDSSTSSTYFYKDVDSADSMLYAGPLWDMDNSIGYDGNASRWGFSYTSTDGWYTRNTRIYRWRTRDSNTSYSSDAYAPLSFYGALATNCADFWQSAQSEWYRNISPAVDVLTSSEDNSNSVLHNVDYYVDTVAKSAAMDAYKIKGAENDNGYNTSSVKSGLKNWLTERQTWINGQFSKVNVTDCSIESISNQTFDGTPSEPKLTLTYNGATLIEGEDYTVSYRNNTAVGTAFADITGKGMYTGTVATSFRIVKGTLDGTVEIPEAAYSGDTLTAVYKNSSGSEVTSGVNYQWYANGVAISGATASEYTVTDSEQGKAVTCTVTGDDTNLAGTVTSNSCTVRTGTKPDNYTETLATWFYDYSINPDDLANASTDGGYTYLATDGQLKDGATLAGSVTSASQSKIKWSDDLFANDTTVIAKDYSPIMGTSKTDGIAWGEYPYFETTLATTGYENITFSAKLGGTNRGPSTWKLQYSLDGTTYTDIANTTYVITNNKSMENAFTDVELPAACDNAREIHIRAVVCDDVAINSKYRVVGITSGDASINNIEVKGTRLSAITSLEAPTVINKSDNGDGTALFDTDMISLKDNNGGADLYYTLGGDEIRYTGEFSPFGENAKAGDTVTLSAYARFEDIESEHVNITYTFAGFDINHFSFDTYTENVSGGALYSNGGAYGGSAKMTAYTDGNSQYVPLWNEKNGAFMLAPDDGALWGAYSGYTFALSTVGFEGVTLTAKAYTTAQGPNSVTLQYSINDGRTWNNVQQNIQLSANGVLEQFFMTYSLPSACDNQSKLLVRLITSENKTHGSAAVEQTELHNNASKGNLYINDVFFAGDFSGDALMPYTNKTSDYFGDTGSIKYYSADGKAMRYSVVNSSNTIIMSGNYNDETGIVIPSDDNFNPYSADGYTVSVWTGDSDDRSAVNTRKYYYKGSTITEFNYNSSTRLLEDYLDSTGTVASSTSGADGTLSMYPNGVTAAAMTADDTYGVKVAWASDNFFTYDKSTPLDTPAGNGYWQITTSTEGYSNITLNAEQLSSNKGPRDWGLAYSTDGTNFTYVANSNAHTISNDASNSTVETYNNFELPSECDNQPVLYIRIFLNGGETIDGNELADMLKGNTGIDNITISGIQSAPSVDYTINTVVLENEGDTNGSYPVETTVTVDSSEYTASGGTLTLQLKSGSTHTVSVTANGTFVNTATFTVTENGTLTVPVVAVDMNGDGFVNGRDYAQITRLSGEKRTVYKRAFSNLVGAESSTFTYEK